MKHVKYSPKVLTTKPYISEKWFFFSFVVNQAKHTGNSRELLHHHHQTLADRVSRWNCRDLQVMNAGIWPYIKTGRLETPDMHKSPRQYFSHFLKCTASGGDCSEAPAPYRKGATTRYGLTWCMDTPLVLKEGKSLCPSEVQFSSVNNLGKNFWTTIFLVYSGQGQ